MTQATADGFELMAMFWSVMNQHYCAALTVDPMLSGKPGEALLQQLVDLYQSQRNENIRRAVCPFLRSLSCRVRHTNIFDAHSLCLVRGSTISKLRVSFRYGDIFLMNEFDSSDLKSIVFDLSTGKKVRNQFKTKTNS